MSIDIALASHTLMRPRDLIQLCNICRDKSRDNNNEIIKPSDILSASVQYSRWKVDDLVSEYAIQYPFLEKLLAILFHGYDKPIVPRKEFEKLFSPYKKELIEEYGDRYFEPVDTLLQILYTVGFLGVIYNGKQMYESLGDKFVVPHATVLEIHRAFRKGLNISDDENVISGNHNVIVNIGQVGNISISGDVSGSIIGGDKKK
jgi:hypothetical protein